MSPLNVERMPRGLQFLNHRLWIKLTVCYIPDMSATRTDSGFTFDVSAIPETEWIAMKNYRLLKCRARSTLHSWMTFGLMARSGSLVKLPAFRVGGRRYTTQAAWQWWNQELDR